jgi:hypothetical protein
MAYENWLPGRRDDQLRMAKTWNTVLAQKGAEWNVPPAELGALATAAETAFQTAKSSERTQVITAQCRDAFDTLVAKMRFIKKRRFLQPPLTDAELVSLSLSPQDLFRLSEASAAGYQLPHSTWTQRKSHRFAFPGESGNRIYLCLCYENRKGGAGPWGPILTAIIP